MIPKVTGYSGFNSYGITPYSLLKPGQKELKRDYYSKAEKPKVDGKNYLNSYGRFSSNQQNTVDKAVKPSDYHRVNRTGKQNIQYE
jgi:hypothetical protein